MTIVDNAQTNKAFMRASMTAPPARTELVAMFRRLATEIVERDFHQVAEATAISELGIDSLGMLEIVGSMERELKIRIPDESLSGITTVADLIDVVHALQGSK